MSQHILKYQLPLIPHDQQQCLGIQVNILTVIRQVMVAQRFDGFVAPASTIFRQHLTLDKWFESFI